MLGIINILLGIALLLFGRRLFWLFVGAAGFVAGVQLTQRAWDLVDPLAIVVGVVVGILFAILAVFLRAIAIGIAGFLAGGSILLGAAAIFGLDSGAASVILYLVGGILGAILIGVLFDWALITLSSLAGAALIVQAVDIGPDLARVGFFVLTIAGVLIQGAALRRTKKDD
jgi:hypothetical protein